MRVKKKSQAVGEKLEKNNNNNKGGNGQKNKTEYSRQTIESQREKKYYPVNAHKLKLYKIPETTFFLRCKVFV